MRKLSFEKCNWSDQAELRLAPACDAFFSIEELKQAVTDKKMVLFSVKEQGQEVCNFVLRVDGQGENKEMVVVCGGGRLKGGSLFNVCTPYIEEIAKICDAKYIRGHVNSAAKAKLMLRAGYDLSEYVFRKEVSHGRSVQ